MISVKDFGVLTLMKSNGSWAMLRVPIWSHRIFSVTRDLPCFVNAVGLATVRSIIARHLIWHFQP